MSALLQLHSQLWNIINILFISYFLLYYSPINNILHNLKSTSQSTDFKFVSKNSQNGFQLYLRPVNSRFQRKPNHFKCSIWKINIFTQSFWNIWSWIKILCRSSVNDASLVGNSFYLLQEIHHETYPLLKEWKMTSTFYLPE